MKRIFTLIALLITITIQSQDIKQLITEYEAYCNEKVTDTIKQYGQVTESWKKVEGTEYHIIKRDTTWLEPDCPEYKYYGEQYFVLSSGTTYTFQDSVGTITLGSLESFNERVEGIQRDYVCECKRRRAVPWSEDFWNWIKNK